MKVFKLCRKFGEGVFLSAYTPTSKSVEYRIGRKTVPAISGTLLMAYKEATIIGEISTGLAFFEAEAEVDDTLIQKTITPIPRLSFDEMDDQEDISDFWKGLLWLSKQNEDLGTTPADYVFPHGTVFCKSITLTKRIG